MTSGNRKALENVIVMRYISQQNARLRCRKPGEAADELLEAAWWEVCMFTARGLAEEAKYG